MKTIIAICGKRRSGKDTIADYLVNHKEFVNVKISNKLKKIVQIMFGFSAYQVEENKENIDKRWGISPRQALQFVGTEVMQYKIQELLPNIDRKFFIKSLIADDFPKYDKIVISDMRFIHEWQELNKLGAFTIKVLRENNNKNECDLHCSELETDEIPADVTIQNNKDIESLYETIEQIMRKHDL